MQANAKESDDALKDTVEREDAGGAARDLKTVRIGYYASRNFQDGAGNGESKGGYSYEYIQKVAAYTGWRYEYVYGTWEGLYKELISGDISTYSGKKIGIVDSDKRMLVAFNKWIEKTQADVEVVSYADFEQCTSDFNDRKIDAFVSADNIISGYYGVAPIEKIGKESYYLCVTKHREDILEDLNMALSVIAISANAFEEDKVASFEAGMNAHKPK